MRLDHITKLLAILMLFCASIAQAEKNHICFNTAAKRFGIEADLLRAIAKQESNFNPRAIGKKNKDGSQDYGTMQYNSRHIPLLLKAGFKKEDLFDNCTSIYLGAHNLHSCIRKYGNTWRAVGCYNAGNRKNREQGRQNYANLIKKHYDNIKRGKL